MTATLTSPELTEVEGKLTERRKSLADIYAEAGAELDMTKVKSIDGDSQAKVEHIRALDGEINDLATKREELRDIIRIGQSVHDNPEDERGTKGADADDHDSKDSIADQILKSEAFRHGKGMVDLDVDFKALMTTAAGWAPEATRGPRVADFATTPLDVLDLIPTGSTNQNAVTYMEETTFTNAAAETAEGAVKPEATLVLTEKTSPVRKIAVTMHVTDEQWDDEPQVRGYINRRMPFMVRQRLNTQIITGDGIAPNLEGALNVTGIQTQAKGTDPVPDAVYKAMVKVMTTGQAMPDAFVTNPLDWQDVRLLRTADGIYIWGSPADAGPERIWGLRTVLAQGMTQNTGLVGDFGNYSELAVRTGITVEVGFVNDDFSKNLKTLRAEMRAALLFYRPAALCSVTGI